jgi:hypothetical protein
LSVHSFNVEVACEFGIPAAILFAEVAYWVERNEQSGEHVIDGVAWFYRSRQEFCEVHRYLSEKQIRCAFQKLERAGVIRVGCFNRSRIDRTRWYTLGPNAERFLTSPESDKRADCNLTKGKHGCGQKGTMEPAQKGQPIPLEPLKNQLRVHEPEKADEQEQAFGAFWSAYPRKQGRKPARKAFDKLDREAWALLVPAVERQKRCRQWQDKQYIPLASTWLRQERWTDEPDEGQVDRASAQGVPDGFVLVDDGQGGKVWKKC